MKKLNRLITVTLGLLTCVSLSAQTAYHSPTVIPQLPGAKTTEEGTGSVSAVPNTKTAIHFARDFGQPANASWTALKDKSMLCRFTVNHTVHRAFYSPGGKLMYTTFGYPGERLNPDLYDKVKSVYYSSEIVFVDEIDRPGNETIYVIELNDKKFIRKLRLQGDDMQVIREFLIN